MWGGGLTDRDPSPRHWIQASCQTCIARPKFTACFTIKGNFMKMLYRWYITPSKLAKMYKTDSNLCWRCRELEGTMYHMWWSCKKIKSFWEVICNEFLKMFKLMFTKKPEAFLLGIMAPDIPRERRRIFIYTTTAAS